MQMDSIHNVDRIFGILKDQNNINITTTTKDGPQIRNILPIHPHDNLRFRGSIVHYIRNIMCICLI